MYRRWVSCGVMVVVLLVGTTAYGQRQAPGGGRGVAGLGGANVAMLLRAEAIQQELKITADQMAKVRDLAPADREGLGNLRDMSAEERRQAMADLQRAAEEREKKMLEILDADQKQRLEEIRVQVMGLMAVLEAGIAGKVGITDAQKEKLEAAQQEMRQAARGAAGGAPDREAMARRREQYEAKIKEVLTEEQLAKLETMKGKPFDVTQLRAGRGGQRGGRN